MESVSESGPWTVYIVRSELGTLYTGITLDLERRLAEHGTARGAKFFRTARPEKVVYREIQPDRSAATSREAEIKRMTRAQKLQLIGQRGETSTVSPGSGGS